MQPETGRKRFEAKAPVHPDSFNDYARWGSLLRKWNAKINLVAPGTLDDFWVRHALDSAQIVSRETSSATVITDFGSGAGFPAIALAIEAKHAGLSQKIHMIESAGKKASFLRTVVRELLLPAQVHSARIEALDPLNADLITARAFAPLTRLLPLAEQHLNQDGRLLLLKGESLSEEIDAVSDTWSFTITRRPSLTDASGQIVSLANLRRR